MDICPYLDRSVGSAEIQTRKKISISPFRQGSHLPHTGSQIVQQNINRWKNDQSHKSGTDYLFKETKRYRHSKFVFNSKKEIGTGGKYRAGTDHHPQTYKYNPTPNPKTQ